MELCLGCHQPGLVSADSVEEAVCLTEQGDGDGVLDDVQATQGIKKAVHDRQLIVN